MKNRHAQNLLAIAILCAVVALPARLEAQQIVGSNSTGQASTEPNPEVSSGGTSSADPSSTANSSEGSSAQAVTKSLPGERPLASLLGLTLEQADAAFGPPEQVFPVRGHQAWEDDVVFYYPDHSYLFWFRDRVWQVRLDRRFAGEAIGVQMGDSRDEVQSVLGKPFHVGQHSEIFVLPDRGFPVRARLFFTDDRLSDLYVYRGDF